MMRQTIPEFYDLLEECINSLPAGWSTNEGVEKIINILLEKGWAVCPPGCMLLPTSVEQAELMSLMTEAYVKGHKDATPKEA